MHEAWTISSANMACAISQKYTNMVVGEHGTQTYKVVVVVLLLLMLLFDVFVRTNGQPLIFLDKQFVQMCLKCQFI